MQSSTLFLHRDFSSVEQAKRDSFGLKKHLADLLKALNSVLLLIKQFCWIHLDAVS